MDSHSHNRIQAGDPHETSTRSSDDSGGHTHTSRVGSLIVQAAQAVESRSPALSAAQIAAQAKKMRSRVRKAQFEEASSMDDGITEEGSEDRQRSSVVRMTADEPSSFGPSDADGRAAGGFAGAGAPTSKQMRGQKFVQVDGKAYNLPSPPAFALVDIGKGGTGGKKSWGAHLRSLSSSTVSLLARAFPWVMFVGLLLATLLAIALLIVFLTVRPQSVSSSLSQVVVKTWTLEQEAESTNSTAGRLYADIELESEVNNPNGKISFDYTVQYTLRYNGADLGSSTMSTFTVPSKKTVDVVTHFKCEGCGVPSKVWDSLSSDSEKGSVPITIQMLVNSKFSSLGYKGRLWQSATVYNVVLSLPAAHQSI